MQVETIIRLDKFKLRPYQRPIFDALERGIKRVLVILPRRAGKDVVGFNWVIRAALKKVGVYYYIFPTYSQGKKVIWDSITNTGEKFLSYIPSELISSQNSQEMKIVLTNGSLIQIVGSDNIDSLMGSNPQGCIFSEFALQDPKAYQFMRPILLANDGWALFLSTPRGKNHMYDLYQIAKNSPDWFTYLLTTEQTQHISLHDIAKEEAEGLMSKDLIQQEYFCSFEQGQEGSVYGKYVDRMRLNGQITNVPWESTFKVHTCFDLGMSDNTFILFFQVIGNSVHIINCYENSGYGLDHYVKILQQQPYSYGKHIAPHDIAVRELGTGVSRLESARRLGLNFIVSTQLSLQDGIEATRAATTKLWIDQKNCAELIKDMESYHFEFDEARNRYKSIPVHDSASHACFVGETLISMDSGTLPIKDIKVGMYVKTPFGIRKVLGVHKKISVDLADVKINGNVITCTPDHLIFTQRGLVRADSLRYNDILEPIGFLRRNIWQKISGFYSNISDIKGFKKICLSLKMKNQSSLMGSFLAGREIIIEDQPSQMIIDPHCKEQYGSFTRAPFLQSTMCTILMGIRATMLSITSKCYQHASTYQGMPVTQIHGLNQMPAKIYYANIPIEPLNGIGAKREENGIKNMLLIHCPFLKVKNILLFVLIAVKNFKVLCFGENFATTIVKRSGALSRDLIMKTVYAQYARLYTIAINTLLKRHVVKNVPTSYKVEPREVFDLTIEKDNCYYANGYLVSNCDCLRYLCISLNKVKDGSSPDEIEARYQRAMLGRDPLPKFFRDDHY